MLFTCKHVQNIFTKATQHDHGWVGNHKLFLGDRDTNKHTKGKIKCFFSMLLMCYCSSLLNIKKKYFVVKQKHSLQPDTADWSSPGGGHSVSWVFLFYTVLRQINLRNWQKKKSSGANTCFQLPFFHSYLHDFAELFFIGSAIETKTCKKLRSGGKKYLLELMTDHRFLKIWPRRQTVIC